MNYESAINATYDGSLITRSSFNDQVYIFRDLSAGGNNPPLYYSDESGVIEYTPSDSDQSSTDWVLFTFKGN